MYIIWNEFYKSLLPFFPIHILHIYSQYVDRVHMENVVIVVIVRQNNFVTVCIFRIPMLATDRM